MLKTIKICLMLLLGATWGYASEWEWQENVEPEAKIFSGPVSKSRWIWFQTDKREPGKAFFRLKFTLDEPVKKAELLTYYEHAGDCYVNGKKLSETPFKQRIRQIMAHRYEFTKELKSGENVIAFAVSTPRKGALLMHGEIELASGRKITLASCSDFKASPEVLENWFTTSFDDSKWLPAMDLGDVRTWPWKPVSDVITLFTSPEERASYDEYMRKATQLPSTLEKEQDCNAKIIWNKEMAGIEVNNKVFPPVLLMRAAMCREDGDDITLKAARAGVPFFELQVTTDRSYGGPGKYDFSYLDEYANRTLALNPDAYFIGQICFERMPQWCAAHPDELIGYATGPVEDSMSSDLYGRPPRPSAASKLFREEANRMIVAMADYIKSKPWGKRVAGFRVSYGVYYEWQHYGHGASGMPDIGKSMTVAFREFLKQRYGTDAALQKAWCNPNITFVTAGVPNIDERWGKKHFLRNPASPDRKVWDYYDCLQEVMVDTMLGMAKTFKENLPGRLCGAYYGYVFGQDYPPEGQNVLLERVLSSPYIDFICRPYTYDAKMRLAGGSGFYGALVSTSRRHGKLSFLEDDSRYHVGLGLIGEPGEGIVACKTPVESEVVARRNFCNALFNGCGIQLLDVNNQSVKRPHNFNSPEILTAIRQSIDIWKKLWLMPISSDRNVVAIFNPEEKIHHGYPVRSVIIPLLSALAFTSINTLYFSGHTFDVMGLKDYLLSDKEYKIVLFLNPFTFNEDERNILLKKLRKPGVTAVWTYAPGLVTEKGFSETAMEELTGIKLAAKFEKMPMSMKLIDGGIMELRGVTLPANLEKIQMPPPPQIHLESPRIHCADTDVKVWGKYVNDDLPALVKKQLPDGSCSIFTGIPIINAELWARILDDAGDHPYTAPGIYVLANGRLLMVHVGKSGSYMVSLPRKVGIVTELYSGKVVVRNSDRLILKTELPMTWLLELK